MSLRCLLFSSDEGTAAPILQVLAGLGVEGEHCADAVATVDKVTHQSFQIVVIDWDQQPEAALLLTAARERKASERPLTLAIVSDDVSVPQALQAGANSILRKPILETQVRETLTTARDLLRSKHESAVNAAHAAAAGSSASASSAGTVTTVPSTLERAREKTLRAGEFLHSAAPSPGGQFETESDVHESLQPSSVEPIDALQELEPMAASVAQTSPAEDPPAPPPDKPRGLEWYMKTRAGGVPSTLVAAAAAPASPTSASAKPELLGYDQPTTYTPPAPVNSHKLSQESAAAAKRNHHAKPDQKHEQKKEAELFAYMAGESRNAEESSHPRFPLKRAIAALLLASLAIAAAPQAPWHPKLRFAWSHGLQSMRGWLNPQPVSAVQPVVAHEDFSRAGDEYKLPVAENIPDATTDPSQIHVLPTVDPTIVKKSDPMGNNAEQPPAQADPAGAISSDQAPPSGTQDSPPAQSTPETQPSSGSTAAPSDPFTPPPAVIVQPHPNTAAAPVAAASAPPRPVSPKTQEPHYASAPGNVPSSLKSHMVTMTPEASGNKSVESAMPSIEPVTVAESVERALLSDQPAVGYPASARGQQGTVILQVLIGRDGTVQDAKFMQGSLAFARTAIDGVKQWKFKPYTMNGRPVSVQTQLSITFRPI